MLIYKIILISIHILVSVSYFHCISHILTPRTWVRHPFLSCLPFLAISLAYETITGDLRSIIRYLLFLISLAIPVFFLFQDKLLRKISGWLFSFFLPMFIETIVAFFLYPVFSPAFEVPPASALTDASIKQLIPLYLHMLPIVFIQCFITYYGYKIWDYFHLNFNLKIICKIAVCPILFASGLLELLNTDSKVSLFIFFLVFIFGNMLFISGIQDLIQNIETVRKNQKMKKSLELLLEDYKVMEEYNLALRLQNHDIANHLQTVEYLITQNQIDEAILYLEEILAFQSPDIPV